MLSLEWGAPTPLPPLSHIAALLPVSALICVSVKSFRRFVRNRLASHPALKGVLFFIGEIYVAVALPLALVFGNAWVGLYVSIMYLIYMPISLHFDYTAQRLLLKRQANRAALDQALNIVSAYDTCREIQWNESGDYLGFLHHDDQRGMDVFFREAFYLEKRLEFIYVTMFLSFLKIWCPGPTSDLHVAILKPSGEPIWQHGRPSADMIQLSQAALKHRKMIVVREAKMIVCQDVDNEHAALRFDELPKVQRDSLASGWNPTERVGSLVSYPVFDNEVEPIGTINVSSGRADCFPSQDPVLLKRVFDAYGGMIIMERRKQKVQEKFQPAGRPLRRLSVVGV